MDEIEQIFGVTSGGEAAKAAEGAVPVALPQPAAPEDVRQTTPMTRLACRVMDWFRANSDHRRQSGVTDRLRYCLEAQTCSFTAQQEQKLAESLPLPTVRRMFVPITSTKIRAAKSMLVDLANQSGEPLFRIEPTPSPTVPESVSDEAAARVSDGVRSVFSQLASAGVQQLPPDVMDKVRRVVALAADQSVDEISNSRQDYARVRAKRMQEKVWDVMTEGGWNDAFYDFIDNVCTYGTGVIVGPVMRAVSTNECVEKKGRDGKPSGIVNYRRVLRQVPYFESVNPMDCYPAPDARDVCDGPLCIRVRYSRDEFWRFAEKGSDASSGWMRPVVASILSRYREGGVKIQIEQYDPTRRYCEKNGCECTDDCLFEGVRCFASVRGSDLVEMGITKSRIGKSVEPDSFYRTETVVVDNRVVFCSILDDSAFFPVSKGTFYSVPGSWWGESIADKVAMCQCVLNNCIKALLQNMPAASGAIFWINDMQRMANKSPDAFRLKAGMTIPFTTSMVGNTGAPIGAVSVPSNAGELLQVWQRMQTQADLDSGVPAFTEGQSAGQSGALRTASGLALYTEASTRGMKMVMTSLDRDVIGRCARLTAEWVLINDDDMSLKGDVEVRPVGLIGKILKAQRDQQRLQLFNMVVTNPTLSQLVGPKGVVELLRPSLQDVDVNPDDVLPSKGKLEEMELVQQIQQVFQATQASQGVQQAAAEGAGAPPGVMQPPSVQGGVAERQGVA